MDALPPYRIFRHARPRATALVVQVRHVGSNTPVHQCELEAYRAITTISTPWGSIRERSRLLLAPQAARYLLAAGTIESLPELSGNNFARGQGTGQRRTGARKPGG